MANKKRLVYIEDETDTLQLVTILLEQNGYEVIGAADGKSGLKAIEEHKPDAVLLDLMLPDISGKAVYNYMKNHKDLKDIPIVVLTSWGTSSSVGLNKNMVEEYILKPFNSLDLLESLKRVLN